ncbi:MAG: hypothetical protein PHG61_03330 [Candidatus Marinimicrobia bacterium]|jgi:hypothetical protein|nr:hypothetical protein [Candidatus Neomarinimicrobiota bacterium]
MPLLSGIYDSNRIQPIVKIKQNLSIWTLGKWQHYVCLYQNAIVPGPASTVEMVSISGATAIAANGTIQKQLVQTLQLNDYEFLHVRFEPLDNVEGLIWELAGQQVNGSRRIHSRVDRYTKYWDPTFASTTFFILGLNRDMNLEVRNPMGYALYQARFIFWGNRMILEPHPAYNGINTAERKNLEMGDIATVRNLIGDTTWVPAEGRSS